MSETDRDRTGRNEPCAGDDRIAELIRLAGPRPEAPRERRERVQRAVRAHWQRETARRVRWRPALLAVPLAAAALIAAVGLVTWRGGVPATPGTAATVEAVRSAGAVILEPAAGGDAAGSRVREGLVLHAADAVSTGPDAGLALRTESGHSVRLAPSTRVELIDGATLRLATGSVFVDSRRLGESAAAPLVVRTALGDVTDVGTVYEVSVLPSALRVRVREGRVTLDGPGARLAALAGEEVELNAGGGVLRTTIAPDAAEWAWARGLLPPLELDGRSLDAFLVWAAREGGWRLVYLDERIARAAPETTLSGSVAGLGLDDALGAVLATCDAAHDVRGGDLRVRSTADPAGG